MAADKWIRVRSDHFDTVGNATDTDLRRIAQTLEHFHDVIVSAVLHGAGASSERTTVIVFKDDRTFTPYKPMGAGRSAIGGFFALGDEGGGTILALNAENLPWAFRSALNGYGRAERERSFAARKPTLSTA